MVEERRIGPMRRGAAFLAAVLLALSAGCDRAVDAADAAREAIEDLDFEALGDRAPEALRALGERAAAKFRGGVDRLSTEESVRQFADHWAPVLDELGKLKEQLGGFLPGREALESVLVSLRERVEENEELRDALEPLMGRLEELLR